MSGDADDTMDCPLCKGHKTMTVGTSHGYLNVSCWQCDGKGALTNERLHLPERVVGRRLRQRRGERGLSLLDVARRIGVGVVELSDAERGMLPLKRTLEIEQAIGLCSVCGDEISPPGGGNVFSVGTPDNVGVWCDGCVENAGG